MYSYACEFIQAVDWSTTINDIAFFDDKVHALLALKFAEQDEGNGQQAAPGKYFVKESEVVDQTHLASYQFEIGSMLIQYYTYSLGNPDCSRTTADRK